MTDPELVQHVVVCYGNSMGYHHGAKYQILSAYKKWYSRAHSSITVVTDKPELFESYPVKLRIINETEWKNWSLDGSQHFGVKLKGLTEVIKESECANTILLDTDMYWISDPKSLVSQVGSKNVVMYQDEGLIYGSKNRSIQKFEESLHQNEFQLGDGIYRLSPDSRMWGSAIIAASRAHIPSLEKAYEIFENLEPIVPTHTVEQFALSEAFRLKNIEISAGKKYTNDWSSIGKKNYATAVLAEFFNEYGENNFSIHLEKWKSIRIKRPIKTLINQKIIRWKEKRSQS